MVEGFTFEFDGEPVVVPENFQEYHRGWYQRGTFYEEGLLRYIRSLDRSGTYVDIGGGVGNHSVFFAKFCRARMVHAFEPNPRCQPQFENLARANGVTDRIVLHKHGVGSATGMALATFVIRFDRENDTAIIPVKRLDEVVTDDDVSIIKIDIEGAEVDAIHGAADVLRRCRPILFVEALTAEDCNAIAEAVEPYGYRLSGNVFNTSPTYEIVPI